MLDRPVHSIFFSHTKLSGYSFHCEKLDGDLDYCWIITISESTRKLFPIDNLNYVSSGHRLYYISIHVTITKPKKKGKKMEKKCKQKLKKERRWKRNVTMFSKLKASQFCTVWSEFTVGNFWTED